MAIALSPVTVETDRRDLQEKPALVARPATTVRTQVHARPIVTAVRAHLPIWVSVAEAVVVAERLVDSAVPKAVVHTVALAGRAAHSEQAVTKVSAETSTTQPTSVNRAKAVSESAHSKMDSTRQRTVVTEPREKTDPVAAVVEAAVALWSSPAVVAAAVAVPVVKVATADLAGSVVVRQ